MNEFGYIAITRTRAAEQQLRLERDQLIGTARRARRQRQAAQRAQDGVGPVRWLRQLLGTGGRRPARAPRLGRTAS